MKSVLGKFRTSRHTDDVIVLLHGLHAGVIIVGVVVVLVLISPWSDRRRHGRIDDLRAAAQAGTLVQRAEARALAQLTGTRTGRPADHLGPTTTAYQPALVIAALASLSGAAIHAAVGPEHFREGWRFGVFFVVLALVQSVQAALLVVRPTHPLVRAVVAVNLGTVVLWVLTRTVGLPFGLAEVESVGVLDVCSSAAEVVAVGCAISWLVRSARASAATSGHRAASVRALRPGREAA